MYWNDTEWEDAKIVSGYPMVYQACVPNPRMRTITTYWPDVPACFLVLCPACACDVMTREVLYWALKEKRIVLLCKDYMISLAHVS